jgi:hypothetical protein
MNPILNIKDELENILEGELEAKYDPEEVVDTLAGAPTFSLGPLPRSQEEVQNRISAAEELLDENLNSFLTDGAEFEVIADDIIRSLRTELRRHIEIGNKKQWHEWADSLEHLLKHYPTTFKCDAALFISLTAQFKIDSSISERAIDGLVANLHDSDQIVRSVCAQGLADVSAEYPEKAAPHIRPIAGNIIEAPTEVRQELLLSIVHIIEESESEITLDVDYGLLAELGRWCLAETSNDLIQNLSLRILSKIVELEPTACSPALIQLANRRNDPRPEIADQAATVLEELDRADVDHSDPNHADMASRYLHELYNSARVEPEPSTQCPSIVHECSDWALMADGDSLDSGEIYTQSVAERSSEIKCHEDGRSQSVGDTVIK